MCVNVELILSNYEEQMIILFIGESGAKGNRASCNNGNIRIKFQRLAFIFIT